MPVIIDNQLKEQIPYDPAVFPISFFHDELETLWQWSGPSIGIRDLKLQRQKPGYWIIKSEKNILH